MIIPFDGKEPEVHPTAYVQKTAQVIGDVTIGAYSSVWFQAVIRGDVHFVRIGQRTNVQDGTIIHVTTDRWPTYVGDEVTIGHRAVLHGCRIGDRCLIGIGAVILDGVELGEECLVAAGTLLPPRTHIPPQSLVMGVPGRVVRTLTPAERSELQQSAEHYVRHADRYRQLGIA